MKKPDGTSKRKPPKLSSASAWLSSTLKTGSPDPWDWKSTLDYCPKGERTESRDSGLFPRFETVVLYGLVPKPTFFSSSSGSLSVNWNNLSCPPEGWALQGRRWVYATSGTCSGVSGGWWGYFLNAGRHNPAGCFFNSLINRQRLETAAVSSPSTGIISPWGIPPGVTRSLQLTNLKILLLLRWGHAFLGMQCL